MKMVIPPCGWRSAGDEIGYCNFLPNYLAETCDLTAHQCDRFARIKHNINEMKCSQRQRSGAAETMDVQGRGRGGPGGKK